MAENVIQCAAVRMRITGDGVLDMQLQSLDETKTQDLVGFQMQSVTEIQPTRLANFMQQRLKLKGSVDIIDEWFSISTIILYVKPVYVTIPSTSDAIPTTYTAP